MSFDFPPISGPGIWRALGITKYLARAGHTVHVFCADRPSSHRRYDSSLLEEVPAEGVSVHRRRSMLLSDVAEGCDRIRRRWPPRLGRLRAGIRWRLLRWMPAPECQWLPKAAWALIAQSQRLRPDCVITTGPPHVCHLAGYALHRVHRVPWIADFRDLWLDDPMKRGPGPQFLVRRLENLVLGQTDAVVTVSPSWQWLLAMKVEQVGGRLPVHLIRNGHDLRASRIPHVSPRRAKEALRIHFAGAPQAHNRTHVLIDALVRIRPEMGARLPIVTFSGLHGDVRERVRAHGLDANVIDVGVLSWTESLRASMAADVLLAIVNNDLAAHAGTIPAKVYEAMALGRHVLALIPRRSDVAPLLSDYGDATVCDVDDVAAVARAVRGLIARHEQGELLRRDEASLPDPRSMVYSRQAQVADLAALIEDLAGRGRA